MVSGEAWNRSAYCGRIGSTMPKPMRSMATVDQMVPNPLGRGSRSLDDDRRTSQANATGGARSNRRTLVGRPGQARRIWVPFGVSSTM
jgi:hypothetical protein